MRTQAEWLLWSTGVGALAWFLPRWVAPMLIISVCVVAALSTCHVLSHCLREWFRIRNHVRRYRLERLVDDVHER